jgi:formylglycine-generating enzyme required for sulfatase activity
MPALLSRLWPSALPASILFVLLVATVGPVLAQDVDAGVVKLVVTTHGGVGRIGSGFVVRIDDERAYVLTAAHVVDGAKETGVVFRSRRLASPVPGTVVGPEHWDRRGLALIVVSAADARSAGARPLPFSTEGPPAIGTDLRFVGHPRTVGDWSSLFGRVAAREGKALKVQVAVEEGSSGGPVLEQGRVIGVVVEELAGIAVVSPVFNIRTYLEGYGVIAAAEPVSPSPPSEPPAPAERAAEPAPEPARLTVRSNVLGDTVYLDGEARGSTRLDLKLSPGRHKVRVEKEGYDVFETEVDLAAGAEETIRATLMRAGPKPGETFRDCDDCPEMVVIPAGSFRMGSPEGERGRASDEGPVHTVTFDRPFAIAKHEVTFDEWDACVRDGGCKHEPGDAGWGRGDRPVINVGWDDAREYLDWLSGKTGGRYRLPSEAEWEYAARAGTMTARFWGDDPDAACRYANVYDETGKREHGFSGTHHACDDGYAKTAPVGAFAANGFGLNDMLGNVWEWTEDCWNDGYEGAPSDGTARTEGDCGRRVVRGGAWDFAPDFVRSANRSRSSTENRDNGLGFRPARTF